MADGIQVMLLVIPGTVAVMMGYDVEDFDGNPIPEEQLVQTVIIVDGQTRYMAIRKIMNEHLGKTPANVFAYFPTNWINLTKMLQTINLKVFTWKNSDFICGLERAGNISDGTARALSFVRQLERQGYNFTAACEWMTLVKGIIRKPSLVKAMNATDSKLCYDNSEYGIKIHETAKSKFMGNNEKALKNKTVPEFIIGLTIVAVGTSTPELVVSVLSAIGGKSDVAIGNVVGSNIFNVFVILGICALVRPLPLTAGNIRRDIPFGVLASLLLLAVASDALLGIGEVNRIGRLDGIVMLLLYVALIGYTIRVTPRPAETAEEPEGAAAKRPMSGWLMAVMIVGGLAALVFGGELFLDGATAIARKLGVSESVIAITLVAGGTSLPELASSLVSLFKGKADMALGNVIGSNIANILLILGLSATIHPLTMGGITHRDLFVVLLTSLLLFLAAFTFRRRAVDRWEGVLFLLLYGGYLWMLIR